MNISMKIKLLVGVLVVLVVAGGVGGWWLRERTASDADQEAYSRAWDGYEKAWEGLSAVRTEAGDVAVDCPVNTRQNTVCDRLVAALGSAKDLSELHGVDPARVDRKELQAETAKLTTATSQVVQVQGQLSKELASANSEVERAGRDWVNNEIEPRLTWAKQDVKAARAVVEASEPGASYEDAREEALRAADVLDDFVAKTEDAMGRMTITEGIDYRNSLINLMDDCKKSTSSLTAAVTRAKLGV
ncbi:MAG: hypothetical protein QM705_11055 [Ancrocorticia sp.]